MAGDKLLELPGYLYLQAPGERLLRTAMQGTPRGARGAAGGRVGQVVGDATEVAGKAWWIYGQQGMRKDHYDEKGARLVIHSTMEMGWYRRGPLERN